MSKRQPLKNHNKFMITERSMNYILRPVQVRKSKFPYTYYVENLGGQIAVTVDRTWTPYNHLVLDFIGHLFHEAKYRIIYEKELTWKNEGSQNLLKNVDRLFRYEKKEEIIDDDLKLHIPKYRRYVYLEKLCDDWMELRSRNKLPNDRIELLEKYAQEKAAIDKDLTFVMSALDEVRDIIFGEAIITYGIEFKIEKLLDRFNMFFRNRRKEYFKDLLLRTSDVKFSLEYPLRVPVYKNIIKNGEERSIIKKVVPKNIKVQNDKLFNFEINGDAIKILFNTFLGNLYAHNLLTLNTDWFEENFLLLDGYASAIYRRFFVIRKNNKFDELPINQIVDYFGLMKNSRYPEVLEKAFEDIKNAGLIDDYKFVVNGGKFSKGYIEVVKSSK